MKHLLRTVLIFAMVCGGLLGAGWLIFDQALHLREDTVATGSMEPEFVPGSRVFIQEGRQPHVNDVVAFHNPSTGGVTVHIFGGYNSDESLKTRGMANDDPDDFMPAPHRSDVIGVVVHHTEIFTASYWVSPRGIGVVLIFLSAAALYGVSRRMGKNEKRKREDGNASNAETLLSASTPV